MNEVMNHLKYIGSFWDKQYWNKHSTELFDDAMIDLIDDIHGLPRVSAERIRRIKVHGYIIE